jgi:hypothetical protein
MSERRSVLLLCDDSRQHAANVLQHIAALRDESQHDVRTFNPVDRPEAAALLDLDEFEAVAIHYTLIVTLDRYLPRALADKISAFQGLKIQFIQDEYRQVDAITARTRELGIEVLFTCMPRAAAETVYGPRLPGVTTITTLPGYAPEALRNHPSKPLTERQIDVGYRGREVPYWLGRLGQDKVEIGQGFLAQADRYGLQCDISSAECDRIYGEAWYRFLGRCRSTLGTESGASIVDFDGSVEAQSRKYLVRHAEAGFAEVEQAVLAPHEGNVMINVVSPRIFEAAALRTAMILFPGGYSGVVEPETHYIPLEKDFSNMDEVVAELRDNLRVVELAERAHADLIASGRYSLSTFVQEVDAVISERAEVRGTGGDRNYRRALRRRRVPSLARPSRLRVLVGTALKGPAAAALVARDPSVRRLAAAGRQTTDRGALAGDLWRLAILRRAAGNGGWFTVGASLEDDGRRLLFSSQTPNDPPRSDTIDLTRVGSAVEEIVWDHSALGETVALVGGRVVATPVGHHGIPGAHSFRALVELSRSAPQLLAEALEPLVRKS